jgi:CHAT domain-containing protein
MGKQVWLGFWMLALWACGRVYAQPNTSQLTAQRAFAQAMVQFNTPNPSPQTDAAALRNFQRVTNLLKPSRTNAPTLYLSYLNAGIITQTNNQQTQALTFYRQAIGTSRRFGLVDSLLYKPLLYAGTAHYYLYEIDSATYYYKKAEQIFLKYPQIAENQRLYNSIGVLYYDAGDYRQSINYYQKALQLLQKRSSRPDLAYIRYTSNIATSRRRLGQYDSAIALYQKLLPLNVDRSVVLINLGATFVEKKDPAQAIRYLQMLKEPDPKEIIRYENTLCRAYIQLGQLNEASKHVRKGMEAYRTQQADARVARKNLDVGIAHKLLGDIATQRKQYAQALHHYQESIIQLDYSFDQKAITRNPTQFGQGFNNSNLFESLAAKVDCLEQLRKQNPTRSVTMMTVDAYRSVLALANHIQKSLDTEESRLFTLQKVYPLHQQAVTLLLQVYDKTKQARFLELAFQSSEQSKASVLYIGRKENESKANTGIPDSLLRQERTLRFSLSQLVVQLDRATSPSQITQLRAAIRDRELALSRLADKLHDYPDYYRKKFGVDSLDLDFLRQQVLGRKIALLSYFQTNGETIAFLLNHNGLTYHRIPNDALFRRHLSHLNTLLRNLTPGETYAGSPSARYLYDRLIGPFETQLSNCESLLIIPHNELTLLSFDALEDPQQRYLLERFALTYQYAASFLRPEAIPRPDTQHTLAVAPFAGSGSRGPLTSLPASEQEVSMLTGTRLLRQEATKTRFLALARHASLIHLATHAIANNTEPSRSYIAFVPQANRDDKLYAHELQYGFLGQTQLIFLSACETGSGQLVRGEGLMSLTRALSYAGCSNLITSLWKAEDGATAYLSKHFYHHLSAGNTVSRSLQLAKLDLLNDPKYPHFHAPQYWSHLVFVGTPNKPDTRITFWLLAGCGSLLVIGGWFLWRVRHKKRSP